MPDDQFEILIIGSGEAGKSLAWTMSKAGRRTAVVERGLIGGSCPNIACLPSKNIIYSAKVAELTGRAAEFGVSTGPVTIEMPAVRARKRQMVDGLINLHLDRYESSGAHLILGEARFVGPKTVEVKATNGEIRVLMGDQVFLNLGTQAAIPDLPGLKAAKPLTHVEALELDRVPSTSLCWGEGS
jgi:pyruvate/2-oxoglutarate dehydrogenase complex dihydrolipoamide dehydrogenase (E3) component